jgi:hypothetical protein
MGNRIKLTKRHLDWVRSHPSATEAVEIEVLGLSPGDLFKRPDEIGPGRMGLVIRPAGGWAWGSGGRACPNTGGSTLSCSRP